MRQVPAPSLPYVLALRHSINDHAYSNTYLEKA